MSIILSSIPNKPARQSPLYTVLSLLLLAAIFYQPYTTRLAIWQRVLDIAAHFTQDKQQQKLYIVLFGGMIIHTTVFVVLNMVMTVIYYIDWPYFEQFKISHKQWPWRDTDPIVRQQYWSLVKKSFVNLFINSYVVSPILFMAGWQRAEPLTSVELSEVPHWYTTAWQVLVFMLIEDTLFYFAHRALHHPAIYRHIHKRHHEFKQPIGIASEYAHAVEFVFSNAIPFTAGPQLLHAHCYTFFIWYIWRIGETIDGHSGYEFPWVPYRLLPFSGSATFHDYHHSRNVGNYSSFFTHWDRLFGTNRTYPAYIHKIESAVKTIDAKVSDVFGESDAVKPSSDSADVYIVDGKKQL